ncbi:hypothetical protein N7499_011578 [Penicillium canescens]|uniref:Uncharacterized protein n=1 Tax=Penicillium canescens TaxID=5083 RepID=A0AAD6IKF3_PENCN|nr:uncharacterized protein N7446_006837 [Penicillium canescens]KAJ6049835.1 hypothetical protein N7444_006551 [Penicillium canescens]KAJ6052195.1 hypothetical protein N7460_002729 [Penicillium canescens]KAJ6062717.1 hypothetical protein N7446_006837 [Penicillium canescens]KAJ6069691.1 hypothetical protein N7499_011578 [Penicillium canescens]KAJ6182257.1 hypothetical protein N7485_000899 [Penicillium canescens]
MHHLRLKFAHQRTSPCRHLHLNPAVRVVRYSAGKIYLALEFQPRRRPALICRLESPELSRPRPNVPAGDTLHPRNQRSDTATVVTRTTILIAAPMSPHTTIHYRIAPRFELSLIMTGKSMNLGVVLITAAVQNLTVGKAGFVERSEVFIPN